MKKWTWQIWTTKSETICGSTNSSVSSVSTYPVASRALNKLEMWDCPKILGSLCPLKKNAIKSITNFIKKNSNFKYFSQLIDNFNEIYHACICINPIIKIPHFTNSRSIILMIFLYIIFDSLVLSVLKYRFHLCYKWFIS